VQDFGLVKNGSFKQLQFTMVKKTWNRSKINLTVGNCLMCSKTLHSRDSNWIINAEGKYFCDNLEIEDSCFDKYINKRKKNEKNIWLSYKERWIESEKRSVL
jgi:hypothetical protein